jgi:hypothetical protein
MLTFNPPDLEQRLGDAVAALAKSADVSISYKFIAPHFDPVDFDDIEVLEGSMVELSTYCCDGWSMSVAQIIQFATEVCDPSTSFDGLIYNSYARTLLRIRLEDARTTAFIDSVCDEGKLGVQTSQTHESHKVVVGLSTNSPHFGISVVLKDFFFDKYFLPSMIDDVFVDVRHERSLGQDAALQFAYAHLFELHSTAGLVVSEWPRVSGEEIYLEDEELERLEKRTNRLRLLLVGHGLNSPLQEFVRGLAAAEAEAELLHYAKCIEYVSATVVREKQYHDLRNRLLDADALSPSAAHLDGLMALFEENRRFTKDAEAVRLAI